MNQYVIKLSKTTHQWMKSQNPVVQRVLGNFIAAHFTQRETAFITKDNILKLYSRLTNKADLLTGCQELDRLFSYGLVGYVS